jgi:hypothetical protein
MVHSFPDFDASPADPLTLAASKTFFGVLEFLVAGGVTLVAEAAFQDFVWRPALERFLGCAKICVVRCIVDSETARERIRQRLQDNSSSRSAHADAALLEDSNERPPTPFLPISLDVPTLHVDTTAGYEPGLAEIAAFARALRV